MTTPDRIRLRIYMRRLRREHMTAWEKEPTYTTACRMNDRIAQVADWYGATFLEAARGDEMPLIDTAQSLANIDALCLEYLRA